MSPLPPSSSARWKSSRAFCAFALARVTAACASLIDAADVSTLSFELCSAPCAEVSAPRALAEVTAVRASASAACACAVARSPSACATFTCASDGSRSAIGSPRLDRLVLDDVDRSDLSGHACGDRHDVGADLRIVGRFFARRT